MTSQRRTIKIVVVVTAMFGAAVAAAVFAFTGAANKAAGHQAQRLVAAIAHDRPSLAPAGAAEYVRGVRRVYGPVSAVRLVKVRHLSIDEHTDDHSHHDQEVAEILVRARRGVALLELSFGTGRFSPGDQPVQGLRELAPGQIPSGLLDAATKRRVESGIRARGGVAADVALSTDFGAVAQASHRAPGTGGKIAPDAAQQRLHRLTVCVKRLRGNPAAVLHCQG